MRHIITIISIAALSTAGGALAQRQRPSNPGCENATAQQCLALALDAMGGKERLQQVKSVRLQFAGHTALMEQSYRQQPFITSYERVSGTWDLTNQRAQWETRLTWPESDGNAERVTNTVVGPQGGVRRGNDADVPCSLTDLDDARDALELGPLRLLLTAAASEVRFDAPAQLRSTPHTVLVFSWHGRPVRVLINRFNHLPDAVDITRQFHDFWFFWGDVAQRTYFDGWKLVNGVEFPTNWIEERKGALWRSRQALDVTLNAPIDERAFQMDAAAAQKSLQSTGWNRPFNSSGAALLAPDVVFFPGLWNSTLVKQSDGIVVIEAPISENYTQRIRDEAARRFPGATIKAVLSTSDSWPHTGGVRFAVSQRWPVYILDLNRPLLDRQVQAPHTIEPDALEKAQPLAPIWKMVAGRQDVGVGPNRLELYPLRGASTERQYMVYFPEHRLLYASDTLALNADGSLYDPELMHEVAQAVAREALKVDTVFGMHQPPMPWAQVLAMIGQ